MPFNVYHLENGSRQTCLIVWGMPMRREGISDSVSCHTGERSSTGAARSPDRATRIRRE